MTTGHKHLSCFDPGTPGVSHPRWYEVVVPVVPTGTGDFETPTCMCGPGEAAAGGGKQYPPGHFKDITLRGRRGYKRRQPGSGRITGNEEE